MYRRVNTRRLRFGQLKKGRIVRKTGHIVPSTTNIYNEEFQVMTPIEERHQVRWIPDPDTVL